MRGPPETIEEIGAIEGQEIISTSNRRHLVDVDYSEYEWMGEEGVEEFDRRCMEELWAEEFMDMVLENVLEDDNEEVVSFLLPIYEDMMQQMGSVTLEETLAQESERSGEETEENDER